MTNAIKTEVREHIKTNHQVLLNVATTLKPANYEMHVYGGHDPDHWTVHSVIAHLAAAASEMLHIARAITTGESPVPPDFDLHRWNKSRVQKAAVETVDALLDKIDCNHQKWLRFLDEIPIAHLHRRGRHGRGDVLSVEGFMRRYAEHELHHANEISEALTRD